MASILPQALASGSISSTSLTVIYSATQALNITPKLVLTNTTTTVVGATVTIYDGSADLVLV